MTKIISYNYNFFIKKLVKFGRDRAKLDPFGDIKASSLPAIFRVVLSFVQPCLLQTAVWGYEVSEGPK